jgi:hypothetical protein
MLEFTGTFCCQGTQQAEITRGKSVWLTESSHGYILGRPCADAGNLAEAAEKYVAVNDSLKIDFTGANGDREGSNGLGAGARDHRPADRKGNRRWEAIRKYEAWFSDTYVRTASGWRYAFAPSSLPLPKGPRETNNCIAFA